jgi:sterol desaturase/sphingolipid hydroxylase (fatty acid hydroxylase superfamily)
MASATEIGGDVVAAGAALAGLMLVYMGALSTSYSTFQPQERRTVRASHLKRTWFAFVGLAVFVAAVTLALLGKLLGLPCMILGALGLLFIGCAGLLTTAVLTALEIK